MCWPAPSCCRGCSARPAVAGGRRAPEGNLLLVTPDAELSRATDTLQRAVFLAVSIRHLAVCSGCAGARHPDRGGGRCCPGWRARPACCCSPLLLVELMAERSAVIFWVAACSLMAVPFAFLAGLLRSRLARGVCGPVRGCGRSAGAMQAALRRVLGDPDLMIAFPLGRPRLVDADGRRRPGTRVRSRDGLQVRGDGQVRRPRSGNDGVPVAVLIYDRSLDEDPELVEAVGDGGHHRAGEPPPARRSPWIGSPSCSPPANGSSPRPTPSGAASNATCMTEPSNGW